MKDFCGIGLCIDSARYIPANLLFQSGNVSEERTVSCYELVVFLKDGGASVINGKKYPILAGSVRFHRPGDKVYSYRFQDIYVLHFEADDAERARNAFADLPSFVHFPDVDREIALFKDIIVSVLAKKDFECSAYLWSLLLGIKKRALAAQDRKDGSTLAILRYIEAHFTENITLKSLSEQFHLHPVYLQRLFKERHGLSPLEYAQKLRIDRAKTYLIASDMTVEAIAEAVGFCNASYFIKVFRCVTASTPAGYRKRAHLPPVII